MHERTKPWLIQKFGGTSVGKFPKAIANVVSEYRGAHNVAIVCSARSVNVKAQGTTTCLLRAAELAASQSGNFEQVINEIRNSHHSAANQALGSSHLLPDLFKAINHECDELIKILHASRIIGEFSPRTTDLVLSVGEKLACLFMTAILKHSGINAVYVDMSRAYHGTSNCDLNQDFYSDLIEEMATLMLELVGDSDAVPVVTGFFGLIPGGLINAIGRGYTDLCAALLAVGLRAEELQIWKEVDGIFTADPRKVPGARLLSQITPEEASEMTYYGSEVIHPFTMEKVIQARIPISIKNVMNPKGGGTTIWPRSLAIPGDVTPLHPPIKVTPSYANLGAVVGPTAVTSKGNIIVLNVHSNKTRQSHGFMAKVFGIFDKWKLVVDLISTSEVHISLAIHAAVPDTSLEDALKELRVLGTVDVTRQLCIVSLVGNQMKHFVGIAGSMFTTLAEAGVNLEMISQGASEINISCVIAEKDADIAVNTLHEKLIERSRLSWVP